MTALERLLVAAYGMGRDDEAAVYAYPDGSELLERVLDRHPDDVERLLALEDGP